MVGRELRRAEDERLAELLTRLPARGELLGDALVDLLLELGARCIEVGFCHLRRG